MAVSAVSKAMYMPLQIASSVAGGLLAGALFSQIWKRISAPVLWVEGDQTDIGRWWGNRYTKAEFHERLKPAGGPGSELFAGFTLRGLGRRLDQLPPGQPAV